MDLSPGFHSSLEGKNMVKPKHQHPYTLLAASAFGLSLLSTPIAAQTGGAYLTDAEGGVVRDTYNTCWHTSTWTPGMATPECDPSLVAKPVAVASPPPAPPVAAAPPPPEPIAAISPPPPPPPAVEKIATSTDVFFDFGKAVIKPEGLAQLDQFVGQLAGANVEVIVAVGYTDSIGGDAYNQKLSVDRAEAVKKYLVGKGVDPSRIQAEGKGKADPIASNETGAGRAKNRRVDLEVVGTRTK